MEIRFEFDDQRVADLLISAFEAGSRYWARVDGYYQAPLAVVEGRASMAIVDREDESTRVTLDRAAVEWGLACFAKVAPRHFGAWLAENDDAETGDVFLQCCLFGEVVYG